MKKLMALLTAFTLVLPFANVKAEEVITDCSVNNSCFVYKPGDEVNFYRSEAERQANNKESGQTTIILEDAGASSKYVKVLALSPFVTTEVYYDSKVETTPTTHVKDAHKTAITKAAEDAGEYPWSSAKQASNGEIELEYITLNQLKNVFGATLTADGTYTIDATKWAKEFEIVFDAANATEELAKEINASTTATAAEKEQAKELLANAARMKKGFYTGEYDLKTNKVWAVEYTLNTVGDKINAITVKQVDMNTNTYSYLPVVSFDKTYDCHTRVNQVEMGCYSCDNDYKWLEVGTQAATCTLVPEITAKGSCVKAVKTGVEDYILEFGCIVALCGIALVVAKKKDLFRSI